jgi:hypothetical protein
VSVPIEVWGYITRGTEAGRVVRVTRDDESTGGYFIIIQTSPTVTQGGFDNWVETEADLEAFFAESGWNVKWP